MIEQIKQELNKHKGCTVNIKCNLGRNKYEKYNATIKELYSNVFIVDWYSLSSMLKSFNSHQKKYSFGNVIGSKLFFIFSMFLLFVTFLLLHYLCISNHKTYERKPERACTNKATQVKEW